MRRLTASGRRELFRDTGQRGGQSCQTGGAASRLDFTRFETQSGQGRFSRLAPLRQIELPGCTDTLHAPDDRIDESWAEGSPWRAVFRRAGRFQQVDVQLVEDDPERNADIRIGATASVSGISRARPPAARSLAGDQGKEQDVTAHVVDDNDAAWSLLPAFGFTSFRLPPRLKGQRPRTWSAMPLSGSLPRSSGMSETSTETCEDRPDVSSSDRGFPHFVITAGAMAATSRRLPCCRSDRLRETVSWKSPGADSC